VNDFHAEEEHNAVAILFDSFKIEEKFKSRSGLRYVVVKDKEEKRLSGMLSSVGELGLSFKELQHSAIACVAIATSPEEAAAMHMGLIKLVPNGIAVCAGCLTKAIATCEENLAVLKDIQEATKVYV